MSKWVSVSNNLTDGVETAIVGYEHRFDEDGVTIAIVTHKTKEVEYKDEAAKTDSLAQEKINEVLNKLG